MMGKMSAELPANDLPRRRFTVDEVTRMVEQGILGDDERVELLDGELVVVSPQGPEHAARVAALVQRLADAYRGLAHVRPQVPLHAGTHSLPEPDLAVVKGQPLDYLDHHPVGAESLLIIEIARTSQAIDHRKARIYAAARGPVYWIVDLAARRIEVFSEPSEHGMFDRRRVLGPGDEIELPGLDVRWRVDDIAG
jgi:Uma2 family endonuclease